MIKERINEDKIQKRLVLVIVATALLLDNMLYMVIVPIMPTYLRRKGVYEMYKDLEEKEFPNKTVVNVWVTKYRNEDQMLGYLFAIKAIVQLFVNPFSGTIIDRVGYEIPLIIGLIVLFSSTAIFALGTTYGVLFFARSLQGLGSAFADTSGLAMIADRFTQEHERSKAMGIALAFISFGCLVAPPFGGVLYKHSGFNHSVPFLLLSLVCLVDAFLVFTVIKPKARRTESGERIQGTPMWKLFLDPYVAICSGALVMANVSLAFLEPTIGVWMKKKMPDVTEDLQGLIWLPAFFPHVAGVYLTVVMMKKYPQYPWLFAAAGLIMEGLSCFIIPFSSSYTFLIIPLSFICFGIALVDTALLPLLGYLVDTRHVSVYGSVYAIADISYSMAYAFGPMVAGNIEAAWGFFALNFAICLSNVLYAPALSLLKSVYAYKPFDSSEMQDFDGSGGGDSSMEYGGSKKGYGAVDGQDSRNWDVGDSFQKTSLDYQYANPSQNVGSVANGGGYESVGGYSYGYDQDGPQPEYPSSVRTSGPGATAIMRPQIGSERVTFEKTLFEKHHASKKKGPPIKYRDYRETDHMLGDDHQEDS
uniref:Major facilitator superfamily (MFS) profile domain-containing protein n=1 Tax=Romanomermis culicivorax TaxID=13658 RepID=A0A915JVN8_ROMCU